MELFSSFKKDYVNYLISIILPAIISAISIPIIKHLLGSEGYGFFSLWFNGVLIAVAILSAWITQSIIRYYPLASDKISFTKKALKISIATQIIFILPTFIIAWMIGENVVLSLLCSILLFTISIQFTVSPIVQSRFLSKKVIWSELIRITTYISVAICLLLFISLPFVFSLFIAAIFSYTFSLIYLLFILKKDLPTLDITENSNHERFHVFNTFMKYGAPFSMWFIFSYMLTYVDKLFTLNYCGGLVQGNYQAIFDLLYKSITLLISPAVISLYPILTKAHTNGDKDQINALLKKVLTYELIGFVIVTSTYWLFGADILLFILKVPRSLDYKWIGFIVISGAFVWQYAIVVQKKYELSMKSFFLLKMVFLAFLAQLAFYFSFKKYSSPLIYPLGFLIASIVYLLLISFPLFVKKIKNQHS